MHQERSQIAITSLGNAREPLFFSAGVLPRNQPEPRSELPPVVECTAIRDRRHDRRGCYRPDSFNLRDTLTKGVLLERLMDLRFHHQNALIERAQLFIESSK